MLYDASVNSTAGSLLAAYCPVLTQKLAKIVQLTSFSQKLLQYSSVDSDIHPTKISSNAFYQLLYAPSQHRPMLPYNLIYFSLALFSNLFRFSNKLSSVFRCFIGTFITVKITSFSDRLCSQFFLYSLQFFTRSKRSSL